MEFIHLKSCVNDINVPYIIQKKYVLIVLFRQQMSNTLCLNYLKCSFYSFLTLIMYFYSFLTLIINFYSFIQKFKNLLKTRFNLQNISKIHLRNILTLTWVLICRKMHDICLFLYSGKETYGVRYKILYIFSQTRWLI